MGNEVVNATLRSDPFSEGFWPDHIAWLPEMASEARFRPGVK
jgi:hypothetical protein